MPILSPSPSLKTITHSTRSTALPSQSYVLSIVNTPSFYAASSSAPTNSIYLLDKHTLQSVTSLSGHSQNAINSLSAVPTLAGSGVPILVSSGADGCIRAWDERIRSTSIEMRTSGKPYSLLSFDVSADGNTVVAGTNLWGDDALIFYWDPRNPAAPLRSQSETHSDDITVIKFAPDSSSLLLSGSTDGLLSTTNTQESDPDEAVLHVTNWGTSISQAGWITSPLPSSSNSSATAMPCVWAGSDMETFSTWTAELDSLCSLDIRDPSIHSSGRTWVTDYLIGCRSIRGSSGLAAFAGSNEGDIALLTSSDLSNSNAPWTMHHEWTRSHVGVVRALLLDDQHNVLVTGGEDAKINIWPGPLSDLPPSADTISPSEAEEDEDAMSIDGDVGRGKRRKSGKARIGSDIEMESHKRQRS